MQPEVLNGFSGFFDAGDEDFYFIGRFLTYLSVILLVSNKYSQNLYFFLIFAIKKQMNSKEKHIISLIKSKIREKDPDADIILFGSHARGTANEDSDWDILILVKTSDVSRKKEQEYRHELFEVELETGEPISTFVYSKSDWETKHSVTPLYYNISKEGIRI